MIKTFTLKKKHFNESLPVTDREYRTGVIIGDYVKVYSHYNKWFLYCLTSRTTYVPPGVGERALVKLYNKYEILLFDHFDITDVIYFKNKKELYKHLIKHYGKPESKVVGNLDLFDKLRMLKRLQDPHDVLRFHQFMYNINSKYYEVKHNRLFQVDVDNRVYVRDMFYEPDKPFEEFIDKEIQDSLQK